MDSGGGGPESNLKLIPYLIQSTLYILNQTKQYQTYKDLIDNSKFDIVQATAVQGPLFTVTACLLVYDHEKWSEIRFKLLEQMILMSHVREFSLNPKSSFNEAEREPMPYAKYKSSLLFWFLIDQFYSKLYPKKELNELDSGLCYSEKLQLYIRTFEEKLLERNQKLITEMQQDLYLVDSFDEFRDVAGIMTDIDSDFIKNALKQLPC